MFCVFVQVMISVSQKFPKFDCSLFIVVTLKHFVFILVSSGHCFLGECRRHRLALVCRSPCRAQLPVCYRRSAIPGKPRFLSNIVFPFRPFANRRSNNRLSLFFNLVIRFRQITSGHCALVFVRCSGVYWYAG